jgi:signal transduction histidine kinase
MRVSRRLYLMLVPSFVALLLMAGLAYWGQYAHTAPSLVLASGTIIVIASAAVTWWNARYVVQRIERLVTHRAPTTPHAGDEIDEIEHVVDRLSSAVALAENTRADRERAFEQRAHDYAKLLTDLAASAADRLEQVRLPLHILLENHFGDLNENQEEMLGAARAAAEAADADMMNLRQLAALDLGQVTLRDDRIRPSDLVDAIRPMLLAAAEDKSMTLQIDVEPLLPAITGDRPRLQDALVALLRDPLLEAADGSHLKLEVKRDADDICLTLNDIIEPHVSVRRAAAIRLIVAHHGSVQHNANQVVVRLPVARPS